MMVRWWWWKGPSLYNYAKSRKKRMTYLLLLLATLLLFKKLWFSSAPGGSDYPKTNVEENEEILSKFIRDNHLTHYEPTLPTNYSIVKWGFQIREWKQVVPKIVAEHLKFKRDGFFVECGALDGVYISNTLHLERTYGWTGLLVEADPLPASILKKRNRNAWVAADVCLSPQPYPMKVEMKGHKDVNGVSNIDNDVVRPHHANDKNFNRKWTVQCFPLSMLMAAINRTEIDYFSLDVEGVELDILKTIPFHKIRIQLISVEAFPGNKEKIHSFLQSKGYRRIKEIVAPTDWVLDDLYELVEL